MRQIFDGGASGGRGASASAAALRWSASVGRHLSWRCAIVMAADAGVAAVSLGIAIQLRIDRLAAEMLLMGLPWAPLQMALVAAVVFAALGVHRRSWRFTSAPDIVPLACAAALAVLLFHALLIALGEGPRLPRSTPLIQWLVLTMLLGGMRLVRRAVGEFLRGAVLPPAPLGTPADAARPALLMGSAERVELLLRQLERQSGRPLVPVGILLDRAAGAMRVRGVRVLGSVADLDPVLARLEQQGKRPQCLLCADRKERLGRPATAAVLRQAQALGLDVAYLPEPTAFDPAPGDGLDIRYVDPAALLDRPQASLSAAAVGAAIAGRRILVTGAGGTIGRELVRQIAPFRPGKLLLLDANEFNLYEAELELRETHPDLPRAALLCSIRQRAQLMQVFDEHRPEIVFHAAALKHVPLVEQHHSAGVQTNVIGTRNVADAVRRFGARAMVQVSTDKAVNPVGFMGVTKRLGELYCQSLDVAGSASTGAPRFMTVRFGNVLGSSGSLIPLFERQLKRGGPLTVTHPEIERFFMTVDEAVQLVLQAAAGGLGQDGTRGRIFVLDMGEPVRVMSIARRMIRLAGLEPGVDVKIDVIGLRPGEKLFEELFDDSEQRLASSIAGMLEAVSCPVPLARLSTAFDRLEQASGDGDDALCHTLARDLLDGIGHGSEVIRLEPAEPRAAKPVLARIVQAG